jgi:murein DD-endopeptidase MepM/ murein hydrolase activator NlpD
MANWKGYRITSNFGWRNNPFGSGKEFHTGIDLVKSHKAAIEAFVSGIVLYAGEGKTGTGLGGYGNVVLIKDNKGRGHLYAHLDSVSVRKGQSIKAGQTIGRQGATGQVTGSHLHYEVRKGTSPSYGWIADRANNCLNPTNYVDGYKESITKSIAIMAQEVIAGKHGNGHENRRKSLGISQFHYNKVRAEVNRLATGDKSISQMATEVIQGKHGNGHDNRRKSLGISQAEYDKVRKEVNKRL